MSHQSTVNLVNKLGSDYDARVIEWRNNMLEEAEEVTTLEYSSTKCNVQYITFQVQLPVQLAGDNYDSSCESVSDKSQSSILAPSFSPISSRCSTDSLTSLEADMQIMDERGVYSNTNASKKACSIPLQRTEKNWMEQYRESQMN